MSATSPGGAPLTCENAPSSGTAPVESDGRRATGDGRRATGDGRRATGDGRRATGDGRRATGDGRRATVLFAARSATALQRLLDVLPVFEGDSRITRCFTLVPGSDFGADGLAAVESTGARTIPWSQACERFFRLVLTASPKGPLDRLSGPRVLLPHGAGFNKTVPSEGSPDTASGLDPAFLLRDGRPLAALHALAHPRQLAWLSDTSAAAASVAAVTGDPALERMLASRSHRERYRTALGTGARRLLVLTSTWGPESLLRRHPDLPMELAASLPQDECQVALVVHPNEHSHGGGYDLQEQLAPALRSGLILARPYEEWAALLLAADAVITDHGSTALYAAALQRPILSAYDGGQELIPHSPMAELLARSPRFTRPFRLADLDAALAVQQPCDLLATAGTAFAEQGHALDLLREKLYGLLGLSQPPHRPLPRTLPAPRHIPRRLGAFAVRAEVEAPDRADGPAEAPAERPATVRVERFAPETELPVHHLAAEHGTSSERQAQSAALLYRRAARTKQAEPPGSPTLTWTADGWTRHVLAAYPSCRTAAVVLSPERCLLRTAAGLYSLQTEGLPENDHGRVVHADPVAVLSAVHAWLPKDPRLPAVVDCHIGGRIFRTTVAPATDEESRLPC